MNEPIVSEPDEDGVTWCQYCKHPQSGYCNKPVPDGTPPDYSCTREPGHDGPCIACGVLSASHDLTNVTTEAK